MKKEKVDLTNLTYDELFSLSLNITKVQEVINITKKPNVISFQILENMDISKSELSYCNIKINYEDGYFDVTSTNKDLDEISKFKVINWLNFRFMFISAVEYKNKAKLYNRQIKNNVTKLDLEMLDTTLIDKLSQIREEHLKSLFRDIVSIKSLNKISMIENKLSFEVEVVSPELTVSSLVDLRPMVDKKILNFIITVEEGKYIVQSSNFDLSKNDILYIDTWIKYYFNLIPKEYFISVTNLL